MYILVYMYTYSRVTSICIDLSKNKLFVFVFVFVFTSGFPEYQPYHRTPVWEPTYRIDHHR